MLSAGFAAVVSDVFIEGHKAGELVGGWDVAAADGAGTVADASEEHTQVGEDFGDGAHSGARAVVGQVLVDADRGGEPLDALNIGFLLVSDQADRLKVLAHGFMMEGVEGQG